MPTIVESTVTTMITTAKLNVIKFVEIFHRALVMRSILSTPIDVSYMETFLRPNSQDGQRVPLTNLGQQLQAITNLYNVLYAKITTIVSQIHVKMEGLVKMKSGVTRVNASLERKENIVKWNALPDAVPAKVQTRETVGTEDYDLIPTTCVSIFVQDGDIAEMDQSLGLMEPTLTALIVYKVTNVLSVFLLAGTNVMMITGGDISPVFPPAKLDVKGTHIWSMLKEETEIVRAKIHAEVNFFVAHHLIAISID